MIISSGAAIGPCPSARAEKISSSSKKNFVFVVNPIGANGKTGQDWKKLQPYLRLKLGNEYDLSEFFTEGPSQATEITRKAIRNGADAVIAVGGDGTLNEVLNGFFEDGKPVSPYGPETGCSTALGLVPMGTGSDFTRTFGWGSDPCEAVDRIARGKRSKIDIGLVTGGSGGPRYFLNVSAVHLSAKSTFYSSKYKRLGRLCYVLGAFQAFVGHRNLDFRIKVDDGDWERLDKVTTICIGNAKYYGGGIKIAPTASPMSGDLQVVIFQNFEWYQFVAKLPKLYSGSHLSEKGVSVKSVQSIEIQTMEQSDGIHVECDGDCIGFLPRKFSILPKSIEMFL